MTQVQAITRKFKHAKSGAFFMASPEFPIRLKDGAFVRIFPTAAGASGWELLEDFKKNYLNEDGSKIT